MKFWAKCFIASVFFSCCWMCRSFAAFSLTEPHNDQNIVIGASWIAYGGGTFQGGTVWVKAWKNSIDYINDDGNDDYDCAGQATVQSPGNWGTNLVYASGEDTDGYVLATQDSDSASAVDINWVKK